MHRRPCDGPRAAHADARARRAASRVRACTRLRSSAWTDFNVAMVGATAALAGLLIVAMSVNIERILKAVDPARAGRLRSLARSCVALVVECPRPRCPSQPSLWPTALEILAGNVDRRRVLPAPGDPGRSWATQPISATPAAMREDPRRASCPLVVVRRRAACSSSSATARPGSACVAIGAILAVIVGHRCFRMGRARRDAPLGGSVRSPIRRPSGGCRGQSLCGRGMYHSVYSVARPSSASRMIQEGSRLVRS